jgi:hypothetical protein
MGRHLRRFRQLNYWLQLLYGRPIPPGTPGQRARRPVLLLLAVLTLLFVVGEYPR